MRRRDFLASTLAAAVAAAARPLGFGGLRQSPSTRKILIAGGAYGTPFIRYMAELTGKTRPKLLLPANGVGRLSDIDALVVSQLRTAQRRAIGSIELHREPPSGQELGGSAALGRRYRLLGRQYAQPAGDLEGAGNRPRAASGLGPRHHPRRRQCRLAVLVRRGDHRFPTEGVDDRPGARLPEGEPLPPLRCGEGPASACIRS